MGEKLASPPFLGDEGKKAREFSPRTALGKRLWEIRQKILTGGQPLLDWDDIAREVRERSRCRVGEAERNPPSKSAAKPTHYLPKV